MERLAGIPAYLGGAVWHGTATRLSDIYMQLFCDDPKSAEIKLIENSVDYTPRTVTGFHGEPVEALSVSSMSRDLGEAVGVHLLVYDHDDLRGALKPDAKGRTPRGDLAAVRALVEDKGMNEHGTAAAARGRSRPRLAGGLRRRGGRCAGAGLAGGGCSRAGG